MPKENITPYLPRNEQQKLTDNVYYSGINFDNRDKALGAAKALLNSLDLDDLKRIIELEQDFIHNKKTGV